jgi:dolichyl-phosphate-mannose-protein mannosyltransferase
VHTAPPAAIPRVRSPRAPRLGWTAVAAAGLCLAQAALLAHTAWDKSDTIDEPFYLAVSIPQWLRLDFASNCEAPALPRWGFGLALRLVDPPLFDESSGRGRHPLWSRALPETRRNLFAARAATILMTLAGGLFLWSAARAFGDGVALVTYSLWCFSPTVLANGALATLDAWVAALSSVAIWATMRFVRRPTPGSAVIVGIALAWTVAAKVTGLGLIPVAMAVGGWALWREARKEGRSWVRPFVAVMGASTLAFVLTLWAVYGFRFGVVDTARPCGKPTGLASHLVGPLPFAPWFEGLLSQIIHGQRGHLGYLFGEVGATGWWWFYLAALALKTTVGVQALAVLRLAAWAKSPPRHGELATDAVILAYPLLLVVVMSVGKAQNGIKYILPAFPLAMLWAGRALPDVKRAFGRWGIAAGGMAVLVGILESVAVHPHHLMFFNVWAGGPEGGPRYFVSGDDWGQDQRRLGEWQRMTRPWRLFYTYYNGDPAHWGITYESPSCEPQPGFYALHAVEVHRPKRIRPGCLDWLTVEPPDARIGYSIYLYQVNKPRIERLRAERGTMAPFWRSGPEGKAP